MERGPGPALPGPALPALRCPQPSGGAGFGAPGKSFAAPLLSAPASWGGCAALPALPLLPESSGDGKFGLNASSFQPSKLSGWNRSHFGHCLSHRRNCYIFRAGLPRFSSGWWLIHTRLFPLKLIGRVLASHERKWDDWCNEPLMWVRHSWSSF